MKNIRAQKLIGKPVVSIMDGKKVSQVQDVIFNPQKKQVEALLIEDGGWFKDAKVIKTESIKSVGEDAVMIQNGNQVQRAKDVSDSVSSIAKNSHYLDKQTVISQEGKKIGTVRDLIFNIPGGEVNSFVVSRGLVSDATQGEVVIESENVIEVGKDALIVSAVAEKLADEQSQEKGARGTLQSAKEDVSRASARAQNELQSKTGRTAETKEKAKGTLEKAKEKAQTVYQEAAEDLSQAVGAVGGMADDSVVGKYLTKNIIAPDDSVIGERGDMITREMLEQAKQRDVANQIYINTSSEPLQ